MATTYSSTKKPNAFANTTFGLDKYFTLESLFRWLGKTDEATTHAIAVLGDDHAGPDLKDWAERYLCGLAGADPTKFVENHKWQG